MQASGAKSWLLTDSGSTQALPRGCNAIRPALAVISPVRASRSGVQRSE